MWGTCGHDDDIRSLERVDAMFHIEMETIWRPDTSRPMATSHQIETVGLAGT